MADSDQHSPRRGSCAPSAALLQERWERQQAVGATVSVEAIALDHLRDADLLAAVRRLPERPRTVIALRYGAQLGTTEIAQQMRMKPSAVSMALGRALARLPARQDPGAEIAGHPPARLEPLGDRAAGPAEGRRVVQTTELDAELQA
ncbi:MAG: sigma-70 family RNA polymerase sigma factor, partial [Candidatus Dormibacterales bacterium]